METTPSNAPHRVHAAENDAVARTAHKFKPMRCADATTSDARRPPCTRISAPRGGWLITCACPRSRRRPPRAAAPSLALAGIACAMIGLSCTISIFAARCSPRVPFCCANCSAARSSADVAHARCRPNALCAEPRVVGAGQLAEPASPRTAPFHQLARNGRPKEQSAARPADETWRRPPFRSTGASRGSARGIHERRTGGQLARNDDGLRDQFHAIQGRTLRRRWQKRGRDGRADGSADPCGRAGSPPANATKKQLIDGVAQSVAAQGALVETQLRSSGARAAVRVPLPRRRRPRVLHARARGRARG